MQNVIVDTDIAIDFLKGSSYAKDIMFELWESNNALLCILSVYELYAGMREHEKDDTDNFISACNIEFITSEIAREGGMIYRYYRKKGITLTSIDCFISATAQIRKCKIATRNINHYPQKELLLKTKWPKS